MRAKKRIGLVLSQVPGYSETFFRNKINGLQAHGYEVFLFVDAYQGEDALVACPIIPAPNFSKRFLYTLIKTLFYVVFVHPKRSMKLYRLNQADGLGLKPCLKQLFLSQHLLNHDLDWLHFGFGTLARDRENVAEAIEAHMGVSFRGFDLYLSPLKHPNCFDLLFQKQVRYHVLAEEMKQSLIEQGILEQHIHVINPAIDAEFFSPSSLRQNFSSPIRFSTIARLHWKKGLEYTLEALALLKTQGLHFEYTIVGTGDQYERLVFAVHQLGLVNEVRFAGQLSPEAVKAVYEDTDIYLQYSIQEGFCNAVLEAQAMGLLCVVSNAEGLSENVLHEQTGWVVPKRSPEFLKDIILSILELPQEKLQNIRTNAMERVRKDFNLKKQQDSFLKFYED